MLTPATILALEEAKQRVRTREGTGDYDPATAAEQLRQLDALEDVEREAAGQVAEVMAP